MVRRIFILWNIVYPSRASSSPARCPVELPPSPYRSHCSPLSLPFLSLSTLSLSHQHSPPLLLLPNLPSPSLLLLSHTDPFPILPCPSPHSAATFPAWAEQCSGGQRTQAERRCSEQPGHQGCAPPSYRASPWLYATALVPAGEMVWWGSSSSESL